MVIDKKGKKFLEFDPEKIPIGKCETFDTDVGIFKICHKKKLIEIYKLEEFL